MKKIISTAIAVYVVFALPFRQGWRCYQSLTRVFAKQKLLCIITAWTLLLCACATGGASGNRTVSLDQAIQTAVENIERNLPAAGLDASSAAADSAEKAMQVGTADFDQLRQTAQGFSQKPRIAVLNFNSPSGQFSEYVLEKLSNGLVNGQKFTVVDRRELDVIQKEMTFQMSGEVSDSTQQAIGKKLGAQFVVSGSVRQIGDIYDFTIKTLNVESAAIIASSSATISARENRVKLLLANAQPAPVSPAVPQPAPAPQTRPAQQAAAAQQPAAVTPQTGRRIAGNVPESVARAVRSIPADALVGIGTAQMATAPQSKTIATNRARASISRQMDVIVRSVIRDYTESSLVNPTAVNSFLENFTRGLAGSRLSGARVVDDGQANDGNYWVIIQMPRAAVIQEINQAQAAAKLAVPAMISFNVEDRMNAAFEKACGEEIPVAGGRGIAGNVPESVARAVRNVPDNALAGIGTAKMGTISYSRTAATTRARSEIIRQMNTMIQDMVRDYTASSEVDPSAALSFTENITVAISRSELLRATVVAEDQDANGNYWVTVYLTEANVAAEINQAQAAAKLAIPAMASFNANDRMDAAFEKACLAEIQINDK